MDEHEVQSRIDSIDWYHDFDFPGGLKARAGTPDAGFHRKLWRFIENNLDSIDFRGKSVLDIGCWDGYWSFYAERRGARSVLATDDISQNWAAGEGLRLAKQLLGSQINVDQRRSVYQLDSIRQTFDIILCLGVYYHLYAPFSAFSQVRHCCGPQTVVVLEGDVGRNFGTGEARFCFGDSTKSPFVPSIDTLDMMIKAAYFSPLKTAYYTEYFGDEGNASEPRSAFRRWWKNSGIRKKWKNSRFSRASTKRREKPSVDADTVATDRTFVVCQPFEGVNEMHYFKPPFGLEVYDPRFRQP